MQIIDNKALIFKTRNPDKYSVIPKSQVVGENEGVYEVAVYWGLDETRVLRNLGVKNVMSPITARYDWPDRKSTRLNSITATSRMPSSA